METVYDVHKNKPCTIPVPRITYEGGETIEYLRGEFTGYSFKLGKYCFSLYNGETVKLNNSQMKTIKF